MLGFGADPSKEFEPPNMRRNEHQIDVDAGGLELSEAPPKVGMRRLDRRGRQRTRQIPARALELVLEELRNRRPLDGTALVVDGAVALHLGVYQMARLRQCLPARDH